VTQYVGNTSLSLPSKGLIHGAQGVRSLTILFIAERDGFSERTVET